MLAVPGGLLFMGYQLVCYGWSQVRGQNAGFFDLLWQGRLTGGLPPADAGSSASSSSQPSQGSAGSPGGATGTGTGAIGSSTGPLVH
jgi:hypothetical protein